MRLPGNFVLHGRDEPPPTPLRLRAGPLTMLFEPESGIVRRICLGDREILRGIYMAVRDRNWGTVPVQVEILKQKIHANSFELSFVVDCRAGEIHFRWSGQFAGASDGTLRYAFDGEAQTSFLRNRIGLCVLHPLRECCGAPAWYERADGKRGEARFPALIEPQIVGQSTFSNLRRLAYEIRPGCWAELEFQGDVFETEDQRNWTDASFKTYCTPLALPFPVEIKAGTRLCQTVTLQLSEHQHSQSAQAKPTIAVPAKPGPAQKDEETSAVVLTIPRGPAGLMPKLGLGVANHGIPLNPEEVNRLSVLRLSHLRVDLRLADVGWSQVLSRAVTEAQQLDVALELALHLGHDGSASALAECGAVLRRLRVPVARVLAFRDSEPASTLATLQSARRYLGLSEAAVGGGSDANFCELNREQALGRFGLARADFISWPMNPQVHAFDNFSVMENLEAQPHTATAARAFAEQKPLVVSPITLRPRFNAVATGEEAPNPAHSPPQVDPRQLSLFNAAWTLGSIAALAATSVASLTYFETTGWRGLMETTPPSVRHPLFPSFPGMVFPVYSVFTALANYSRMASVSQPQPGRNTIASLCLFDERGRRRLLCANLTASELLLALDWGAERASIRNLNLAGLSEDQGLTWSRTEQRDCPAGILRLALAPYALASLDSAS
jgi:D-apionolactonase